MTIPANPIATLWQWVARAPLPVVLAFVLVLASWVWAIDNEQANQKATAAVAAVEAKNAAARASDAAASAKRVEDKLDKLLEIVLKEQAEKAAEEKARAAAAAKKKENH